MALRQLGAIVVVACATEYRAKVEAAGLGFGQVRPSFEDMQRHLGMDRAQLTEALLARSDFLFRNMLVPALRASYEDMDAVLEGADLVLTSSLAVGARLAAERRGIPWIGVVLQPFMFLSAFDPPMIPKAEWLSPVLRRLGPTVTRVVFALVKRAVGRLLRPVGSLRREIGLPPTTLNVLFDGQFSSYGAIGLYSTVLGDVQPDYPQPIAIVGFATFDSDEGRPTTLEPGLADFLESGAAPVVFTLGSLIVNSPGTFYNESLAAARLLGRRAVLLVGESGVTRFTELRSPDVYVCAYAAHSQIFPRAAAIVHQGGIGTLAQGLRSGRPQLVVPHYADQLDNAVRAVKLGVARLLAPRRYRAKRVARELAALLTVSEYARCASSMRKTLAAEDGAARAAAVVLDRLLSPAL